MLDYKPYRLFITLEGIEGSGKSTQLPFIARLFTQHGYSVRTTREPGGSQVGEQIRQIVLDQDLPTLHPDTELLLMFAARTQHYHSLIKPALQENRVVISDRFIDASYAYQGGGRGITQQRIEQLNQWALDGIQPDLTLLFDVDPLEGLRRAAKRGATDRFEQESLPFFKAVRQAYLERARHASQRIKLINANRDIEYIRQSIYKILRPYIPCPT